MTRRHMALTLAADELTKLERWTHSRKLGAEDARRARVDLILADGQSFGSITDQVACYADYAKPWTPRFQQRRLLGLQPRSGLAGTRPDYRDGSAGLGQDEETAARRYCALEYTGVESVGRAHGANRRQGAQVRLVVPRGQDLHSSDAHLCKIAAVLGAECVELQLPRNPGNPIAFLDACLEDGPAALAIRPSLWRAWLSVEHFPTAVAAYILRRFRFVIVFDLQADAFCGSTVRELSGGQLTTVRWNPGASRDYQIASQRGEICGPFAGLRFRAPAPVDDRFLEGNGEAVETLVWTGTETLFARLQAGETEVFFLGATPIDLDMDVARRKVSEYFSALIPFVMFIRRAFKTECWRPPRYPTASLIIDDPPLWPRYGFVDFERLLHLMDEHEFHTTIAFIPYYWNRERRAAVSLFHQRPDRLSLCYHGNNHTADEFASHDATALASMVQTAMGRMGALAVRTGLQCGKVMVFPHGAFSQEAMSVLRSSTFVAAVNGHHRTRSGEQLPLRIEDLMQPSVMTYGGFPLFLRQRPWQWTPEDVAFHALFGRPILLGEHHGAFKEPGALLDVISMINGTLAGIRWCSAQDAVQNALLQRRESESQLCVRPYAGMIRLSNESSRELNCVLEWPWASRHELERASIDGSPAPPLIRDGDATRLACELAPGAARTIAVCFRDEAQRVDRRQSATQTLRVHTRRRLTEVRDNYLAKSPLLLSGVQSAYRKLTHLKG